MIAGLDHANIYSHDLEATRRFYVDLLGLTEGFRPDFGFPGVWFYHGGRPIMHIVYTPEARREVGALDHVSFEVLDFDAALDALEKAGVEHWYKEIPDGVGRQAFLTDPNGVTIELTWHRR